MSVIGKAALAMWWDMSDAHRSEFEHWHTHEHFPERLGIPGFRRVTRWTSADGDEGIFVMYELDDYEVLASPAYVARLNAPTPSSARLMPHHRNMVRSQCRVLESGGINPARNALTIRLSPAAGRDEQLRASIRRMSQHIPFEPGFAGLHLLRHETPPIAATKEQKIRGNADRTADWVLVACGYDADALRALAKRELSRDSLVDMGADAGAEHGFYELSCSATPLDVANAPAFVSAH
jgi:heme-degrading monooxygenase HmoA